VTAAAAAAADRGGRLVNARSSIYHVHLNAFVLVIVSTRQNYM